MRHKAEKQPKPQVRSSAWLERSKRRVDEATAVWLQAWHEAADAEQHEAKTRQVMLAARRRYEAAMRSNDGTQRPGDAEATNATRATPPGSLE